MTQALTSSQRGIWTAHCQTVAGQHAGNDEDDVEDAYYFPLEAVLVWKPLK